MSYQDLVNKARDQGRTARVVPEWFAFDEKGKTLVGRFLSKETVQSKKFNTSMTFYYFDTDDGAVKVKLGGATDKQVSDALVPGKVYVIEYTGKEKLPTGQERNTYDIQVIREEESESVGSEEDVPF